MTENLHIGIAHAEQSEPSESEEYLMTEELYIGIARAPAGHIAHAVSLDDLGSIVNQISFAWTPEKLYHALGHLSNCSADIFVGLDIGTPEPEIEKVLRQANLHTRIIGKRFVENLFNLLPRRKRNMVGRAHLVAQILWFMHYQPFPLVEGR